MSCCNVFVFAALASLIPLRPIHNEHEYDHTVAKLNQLLDFLMTQHQLTQSDLPEIGTQGVVSEILRGKRTVNLRQVKALAQRFAVDASMFL